MSLPPLGRCIVQLEYRDVTRAYGSTGVDFKDIATARLRFLQGYYISYKPNNTLTSAMAPEEKTGI